MAIERVVANQRYQHTLERDRLRWMKCVGVHLITQDAFDRHRYRDRGHDRVGVFAP